MDIDLSGEKLKSLHISSLDEEEDEEEDQNDDVEDEVSDEDDEEEDRVPMTLGFVEKPKNPWTLLRQYFPSKAGGTPAWLDPINLPSEKSSLCDFCGEPLQFLLQVYAPLPEESTFHRTLFVFMCPSMTCLLRDQHEQWKRHPETPSRSVKVFRCQLPRVNSFYSSEAPAEDGTEQPLTAGGNPCPPFPPAHHPKKFALCVMDVSTNTDHMPAKQNCVIGAGHGKGIKFVVAVEKHGIVPGNTRLLIGGLVTQVTKSSVGRWTHLTKNLNQYEIANEDEGELDEEMANDEGSASSLISRSRTDGSFGKLQTYFKGNGENRSWASFQERISLAPEQVLRYSSSAEAKPLWPVSSGRPSKLDIPKCNYCGGTRGFEFQVLPQLLYFFHVKDSEDSLDWATIVVYTCEASCEGGVGYKEEFAWVQLASQSISHR
ncbi:UNVERIFIED_CONTAM: Programmed cell death protein 2-like protein [Sesamum indicum]